MTAETKPDEKRNIGIYMSSSLIQEITRYQGRMMQRGETKSRSQVVSEAVTEYLKKQEILL